MDWSASHKMVNLLQVAWIVIQTNGLGDGRLSSLSPTQVPSVAPSDTLWPSTNPSTAPSNTQSPSSSPSITPTPLPSEENNKTTIPLAAPSVAPSVSRSSDTTNTNITNNNNMTNVDDEKDYWYAPHYVAATVNKLTDFTFSAFFSGNRDRVNYSYGGFLFGFHGRWGGSPHKIPFMQIGGINWIHYGVGAPYPPNLLDGTWHHFVATRQDSSLSYYIDGIQWYNGTTDLIGASISSGGTLDDDSSVSDLVVGWDLENPSDTKFCGELRHLGIWNRALTSAEIETGLLSNMMENVFGRKEQRGLVAFMPCIPTLEGGFGMIPAITTT